MTNLKITSENKAGTDSTDTDKSEKTISTKRSKTPLNKSR